MGEVKVALKLALVGLALFFSAVSMAADVRVRGYVRKDGTYVAPHYRTSPDGTRANNYSTQGNYNPYTGQAGTKPLDVKEPSAPRSKPITLDGFKPSGVGVIEGQPGSNKQVTVTKPISSSTLDGLETWEIEAIYGKPEAIENFPAVTKWFYTDKVVHFASTISNATKRVVYIEPR